MVTMLRKKIVPVAGLERSYGKIFNPVTEVTLGKPEISVTGPARHFMISSNSFTQ